MTAYVEELRAAGADIEKVNQLLGDASLRLRAAVIKTYALDENLPGIIILKCGHPEP